MEPTSRRSAVRWQTERQAHAASPAHPQQAVPGVPGPLARRGNGVEFALYGQDSHGPLRADPRPRHSLSGGLSLDDLQGYVQQRGKEKGRRKGRVSPTTMRKELSTFSAVWSWARATNRVEGAFANKGLRFPKRTKSRRFRRRRKLTGRLPGRFDRKRAGGTLGLPVSDACRPGEGAEGHQRPRGSAGGLPDGSHGRSHRGATKRDPSFPGADFDSNRIWWSFARRSGPKDEGPRGGAIVSRSGKDHR